MAQHTIYNCKSFFGDARMKVHDKMAVGEQEMNG
jgi:hypothetical protein